MKSQVRNTIQRSIVYDMVGSLKNHPTADEVYSEIYKAHPTISRGTVYRNLNMLAETGQLLKIEIPDSADRFDHQTHKHYHIKCTSCGDFADVSLSYMDEINALIQSETGYKIEDHAIVFKGLCKFCQE